MCESTASVPTYKIKKPIVTRAEPSWVIVNPLSVSVISAVVNTKLSTITAAIRKSSTIIFVSLTKPLPFFIRTTVRYRKWKGKQNICYRFAKEIGYTERS